MGKNKYCLYRLNPVGEKEYAARQDGKVIEWINRFSICVQVGVMTEVELNNRGIYIEEVADE